MEFIGMKLEKIRFGVNILPPLTSKVNSPRVELL